MKYYLIAGVAILLFSMGLVYILQSDRAPEYRILESEPEAAETSRQD